MKCFCIVLLQKLLYLIGTSNPGTGRRHGAPSPWLAPTPRPTAGTPALLPLGSLALLWFGPCRGHPWLLRRHHRPESSCSPVRHRPNPAAPLRLLRVPTPASRQPAPPARRRRYPRAPLLCSGLARAVVTLGSCACLIFLFLYVFLVLCTCALVVIV